MPFRMTSVSNGAGRFGLWVTERFVCADLLLFASTTWSLHISSKGLFFGPAFPLFFALELFLLLFLEQFALHLLSLSPVNTLTPGCMIRIQSHTGGISSNMASCTLFLPRVCSWWYEPVVGGALWKAPVVNTCPLPLQHGNPYGGTPLITVT